MYLSCHRFVHAGELNWAGLRVAGLCVGIDKYTHAGNLNNASRDAEAMNERINSSPGCQSANLCAPATVGALLRGIRHHAQDAGLQQNPPKLFMVYYAGHGIQTQEKKVYLVPSNAHVEHLDDLEHECLALDKLLLMLRQTLDEPVRRQFGEARAIVFVVVQPLYL